MMRSGTERISIASRWRGIRLDPEEARRLSRALDEEAAEAEARLPPGSWEGEDRALRGWKRLEAASRLGLVAGIVLIVAASAVVAYAGSTTTTLQLGYTVSGASAPHWQVTLCNNASVVMKGGGQSWDCSLVIFNNDFTTHTLQGISIQGGDLSTPPTLPLKVPFLSFVALTVVGKTPYFGGTENVSVSVYVGS